MRFSSQDIDWAKALRIFNQGANFFDENRNVLRMFYPRQYVAIHGRRIVAYSYNRELLYDFLCKRYGEAVANTEIYFDKAA